LPGYYDAWTVIESFLIACLAGFVAFESVDHIRFSPHPRLWAALGGVALGMGIWSMHFVGMVAWHPPFPLYYAIGPTIISVLVAIAASVLALFLVTRESARRSATANFLGALIVGTGICSMHYIGMSALRFTAPAIWSGGWVVLSFVIAVGASWAAMQLLRRSGERVATLPRQLTGSIIIAVAICGMHYVGMQAFMLHDGATSIELPGSFKGSQLAQIGVANAMLFTIALLVVSYRDKADWVHLVQASQLEAREAARRLESMAAVRKIATSVAHEINNPLESVMNLLYLTEQGQIGETERGYVATAQQELKRIATITTHTLRFYRQQSAPAATSIPELFESAVLLFQASLRAADIRVKRDWPPDVPRVVCCDGEIRQVIANLVSNAIDAMPQGGTLSLSIRAEDRGVHIEVCDDGTGMPAHVQQAILEPFFTTKGLAGTGLGLSISSEIISRHGGSLEFASSDAEGDHGTCFLIFLPFSPPEIAST